MAWCPRRALLDSKKNFIKNEFGIADLYFAKPPGTLSGNLNSFSIRSWIFSSVSSFHCWPITWDADVNDLVVGAIPPKDARKSFILPPFSSSKYKAPLTIAISSSARFETYNAFNQLLVNKSLLIIDCCCVKTDLYNLQQMHLVSSMEFSVLLWIDFILIARWR